MSKTLFIIGAGASSEVKLPAGHDLKKYITNLLDFKFKTFGERTGGDYIIYDALRAHTSQADPSEDIDLYLKAAWHIRDAMPQAASIDNFIDTHKENGKIELCGKLAIVRAILEAERKSLLYIDNSNIYNKMNFTSLENTWYVSFVKLLAENCMKEDLSHRLKSVVLIVFNYDRCIEHFLYNSFQNYYGIEAEEAAELVNEIEIYHPYGVVGSLPWQQSLSSITYGDKPAASKLLELANQIKTFTEGTDPNSSEIEAIHKHVGTATTIVFLGFAYHQLNMELINGDCIKNMKVQVFGTAKGMSSSDCDIIQNQLFPQALSIGPGPIYINNHLDCSQLFNEFRRSLSLK